MNKPSRLINRVSLFRGILRFCEPDASRSVHRTLYSSAPVLSSAFCKLSLWGRLGVPPGGQEGRGNLILGQSSQGTNNALIFSELAPHERGDTQQLVPTHPTNRKHTHQEARKQLVLAFQQAKQTDMLLSNNFHLFKSSGINISRSDSLLLKPARENNKS